MVLIANW